MNDKKLIVIAGPTAVGKTSLAIEIAQWLKTEIISCDSRQIYQETDIGTAKPNEQELALVQHHFINSHSIHQAYSAGTFEKEALSKIDELFAQYDHVLMVGGSGLYIDAVCNGFDDMPEIPSGIREKLNQRFAQNGLNDLLDELKIKDPDYYALVDRNNHQRVIRALEVIESTGKTFSYFRGRKNNVERPFQILKIAINDDVQSLYDRINQRMDMMIANGLFDEAKALYSFRNLNALQTVGYTEIFEFLNGKYDYNEAVRLLKRNSRRYAKRQLTWLRRDQEYEWFTRHEKQDILNRISQFIS